MSGVLKAVGKVFKKVVKVVKKIAVPALMIGAVVLTGGAALGALPALGTMLGSVGITGTMAGVLGGAISMGAVGAVTGGVSAAIQGKSIMKGATSGFLVGAATGGIGGGLGLISPNGILSDMGIGSSASAAKGLSATATNSLTSTPVAGPIGSPVTKAPLLPGGASTASAPGASNPIGAGATKMATSPTATTVSDGALVKPVSTGAVDPTATSRVASASGVTTPGTPTVAAPASTGLGGLLSAPNILQLAGSTLAGFAQGSASSEASENQLIAMREDDDRTAMNYGYRNVYETDSKGRTVGGVPIRQDQVYEYGPQNLARPNGGLLASSFREGVSMPYFQIVNGQVVQVGG